MKKEFTLIEPLVVVTMLGILVSLVFPSFLKEEGEKKEAEAKRNIRIVESEQGTESLKVIADFKTSETSLSWRNVNDSVMGGVSRGGAYVNEAYHLSFSGTISLQNNGGFSSTRSFGTSFDLSDYAGLEIRIKGDGRKYYFTSRANNPNSRLGFWYAVETKEDEWIKVKIPFEDFYATSFGRKIPGMRLNVKNITSFGLMLYDKKDGPFSMELDYIKAYK